MVGYFLADVEGFPATGFEGEVGAGDSKLFA
jgi:hypothetical protein